jgi:short subunit dehydrogenase-like uncharacterized protein
MPALNHLNASGEVLSSKARRIAVFGACGHTGRFVVGELQRRGITGILVGRHEEKLKTLNKTYPTWEARVASVEDTLSFDRALVGACLVINCAGPFLDTAVPVIEAALRARIHYLDITAEQAVALTEFEKFSDAARDANILIVPSMAFYGGLGDLLAAAAMGDWTLADEIRIAVALDSWKPTRGTRLTGQRNTARRLTFSSNRLTQLNDPPGRQTWVFPPPFGTQEIVVLPLAETILISRHLQVPEIHNWVNLIPLADLRDPDTPAPTPADESGRSGQKFFMEAVVRRGAKDRRATAAGRDIYATTAPLVVEAAQRILNGGKQMAGTVAPGEIFDPKDFLRALSSEHFSFELRGGPMNDGEEV